MYCAVCVAKVAVSGEEVPVPEYTVVNEVPFVETSTL